MLKRLPFFLLLVLILGASQARAQGKRNRAFLLDSLRRQARQHPTDSFGARAITQMSEIWRRSNPDSAVAYARRSIKVARPYPRLAVLSYNMLAIAEYYRGGYPAALAAFDSAYLLARAANDPRQMGEMKNNRANVYIEQGNYAAALENYQQALAIHEKAGQTSSAAMTMGNIGYAYKDIGDYDRALEYFFRSLRSYEQQLQVPSLTGVNRRIVQEALVQDYNYIGETYKKLKSWAKAREYFTKAMAFYEQRAISEGKAATLRNLAEVDAATGRLNEAVRQLREALAIHERTHDVMETASAHASIGELLQQQGQPAAAIAEFEQAVAMNRSIHNVRSQATAFMGLAAARIATGSLPAARQALDSARVYVRQTGSKQNYRQYYETESNYFARAGDNQRALTSYRLYSAYKDSLVNADNVKAMADVAVKYETDKKEQLLKLNEQQLKLQEAKISRRNLLIWAIVAGVLALALLAYSYYRRYRLQQQARLQQAILEQQSLATRAVLDAEEKERRRIALDLHDGVGQVMSAAKMNLAAIEEEIPFGDADQRLAFRNALQLVDEGCREVRAVSHSMMPNALLKAGLGAAIREFLDQIDHRVLKINLLTEGLNEKLDSNTETVLYRVVQECVNNVIKHAQASQLDLSLRQEPDGISAMIEDNGRGFDTRDRSKFEGIGLKNIQSRLALLGGSVEWSSQPGRGTAVAVFVPTAKPQ